MKVSKEFQRKTSVLVFYQRYVGFLLFSAPDMVANPSLLAISRDRCDNFIQSAIEVCFYSFRAMLLLSQGNYVKFNYGVHISFSSLSRLISQCFVQVPNACVVAYLLANIFVSL